MATPTTAVVNEAARVVLADADALLKGGKELERAASAYRSLLAPASTADERQKELAMVGLAEVLARQGRGAELRALLVEARPFFATLSKARTAKTVRAVLDAIARVPDTLALQKEVFKESVAWAREQNLAYLRQRIELNLAALEHQTKDYQASLALLTSLLREVKRLDDKALLVEIHLLEAQVHHSLRNLPKAKAALTAARTAANSIYCPPPLQAQIDMMAGILHSEEKDPKTAFSYFYEAFETYSSLDEHTHALQALQYMLLMKVLVGAPEEVAQLLSGKLALKYAGPSVELLRQVAGAYKQRSLKSFEEASGAHKAEVQADPFLRSHLDDLYDTLLEKNLLRLVEPYSVVEIAQVARLIGLPLPQVERKLSQMILDKKLHGILDQGMGTLQLFDEQPQPKTYQAGLDTIEQMGKVVDALYDKLGMLHS